MGEQFRIFDRRRVRRRRDRAAAVFARHDFLFRAAVERLSDRLLDVKRQFPCALVLGCGSGVAEAFGAQRATETSAKIGTLIEADVSIAMCAAAKRAGAGGCVLAADEEFLPFADSSFDLVVSVLGLHWVNDVPGALVQILRALKPDGLFLGALLGAETLFELRQSLLLAETEIEGGVSPRLSPLIDVRDAGQLLQRAGFALALVDRERIAVSYPDPFALMRDLRGMGETNALITRRKTFSRRATFRRAAEIYAERFGGSDGRIGASFELLMLSGWRA
jgi:SAM-dependent methyltransferase